MEKINLTLTNNYIFQKVFGKKGNEEILKDFLISILNIPIEKIEIQTEVSLEKHLEKNKLGRLDIIAILNDDTIVNIEMQVNDYHNFIERSLYYWSGIYYNNLEKGEDYKIAKRTIGINILNYTILKDGPYHEICRIRRDHKNKILTDKLELHFIQIPKFLKEKRKNQTKLEQWMQFIIQRNKTEVELAMKENKAIKKANEEYEYLIGDEEERRLAYLIDKNKKDQNTQIAGAIEKGLRRGLQQGKKEGIKQGRKEGVEQGLEQGRKEGVEQGLEQGRKEGVEQGKKAMLETAKKLLNKGMSVEEVQEITNLTAEEMKTITKD